MVAGVTFSSAATLSVDCPSTTERLPCAVLKFIADLLKSTIDQFTDLKSFRQFFIGDRLTIHHLVNHRNRGGAANGVRTSLLCAKTVEHLASSDRPQPRSKGTGVSFRVKRIQGNGHRREDILNAVRNRVFINPTSPAPPGNQRTIQAHQLPPRHLSVVLGGADWNKSIGLGIR